MIQNFCTIKCSEFSATPIATGTVPAWLIGLLVLICLLLVGIITLIVLHVLSARSSRKMKNGPKSLDVRPIAPKPHSGPILQPFMD